MGLKMKSLTELKKTSFDVPASVRKAAAKGLELRAKFNRGGLSQSEASDQGIRSGVSTAKTLVKGVVGLGLLKAVRRYLIRHAIDSKAKGDKSRGFWGDDSNPSAGWISWHLWGGDSAKRWTESILKNIED